MYNEIFCKTQNDLDMVLDYFDFDKVRKVMEFLDWTWHLEGVPDVPRLRQFARKLIRESIAGMIEGGRTEYDMSCGGFWVHTSIGDNSKIYIDLKFVLTNFDNYD